MASKVSIVMPVYNAERYLKKSLESVTRQTLRDIEILCVDDGSTDASPQIIADFARRDARIRTITKENAGYGAAMNDGMAAATGEYIGVVEPDDYVDATMFERLYQTAVEHDADVCKCDFYSLTSSEGSERTRWREIAPGKAFYGPVFDSTKSEALFFLVMMTWEGIYRRSFIEKNRIVHTTTPGASHQDNSFWFITTALAERYVLINEAHYYYRIDNSASSIHSSDAALKIATEYSLIRDILEERELWNRLKFIYSYFYFDNLIARLAHVAAEQKTEFARYIAGEWLGAQERAEVDRGILPAFLIDELDELSRDPDAYRPEDHRSIEVESWDEVEGRHERTEILTNSISPYSIVRTYKDSIVA